MLKDKKIIAIIILSLIILGGIGVYSYNQITEKAYNQGVQDTSAYINQEMINSLNKHGYIPFPYTQGNQTYQLRLGIINQE